MTKMKNEQNNGRLAIFISLLFTGRGGGGVDYS